MPIANTNRYEPDGEGGLVIVTRKGDRFRIDAEDISLAMAHCWSKHESGYARAAKRIPSGKMKTVYLHRLIQPTSESFPHVDHINGDPTDNRKTNLRVCSRSQNMKNAKRRVDNRSGVKGVRYHKEGKFWTARIKSEGKIVFYGCYGSLEAAKQAILSARPEAHEEFARHE